MKTEALTFDIDSTLASTVVRAEKMINRLDRSKTDWTAYAMACESDTPTPTVELLRLLYPIYNIVLVSARPEVARDVTLAWLKKHDIPFDALVLDDGSYGDDIVTYKVKAIEQIDLTWPVKLHIDDYWDVGVAVQDVLSIPSVTVSSYSPKDMRSPW